MLLANYIFEASWSQGLRAMLQAPSTKHAFLHMNTFEKDKFLKFCNMSAGAKVREDGKEDPTMINELRINLTTEPYGVFYLEQIVSIEDI